MGVLSQILPLTPLGLGTRDLSLIALFSSFGISREKTLVFSWVEFIVASIVSLSLVYAMSWILEKTRNKDHELNEEVRGVEIIKK